MENKKLLKGALPKNVVMGLAWLFPVFGIVAFALDYPTLDLEEKRAFVSIFVTCVVAYICAALTALIIPAIIAIIVAVLSIIATIKAFMGETYNIPVVYGIACKIIKE